MARRARHGPPTASASRRLAVALTTAVATAVATLTVVTIKSWPV